MRRLGLVLALVAVVLATTGCWDIRDINDRTPALGVGVDLEGGTWRLTLADVRPEGGQATMYTASFESGVGPTLQAAAEELRGHLAFRLYFGSARIIAIGSSVFEAGRVGEVLAYFREQQEISLSTFLVASTTSGADLLKTMDVEHGAVAVRLEREMTTQESLRDGHLPIQLWQALASWTGPGRSVYVPLFAPEPGHGLRVTGTLVASARQKTPVYLGIPESQTLRLLADVPGRAPIVLPDGSSLRMAWSTKTLRVVTRPTTHLELRVGALLEPRIGSPEGMDASDLTRLETEVARAITGRLMALTAKLGKAGVDVMRGGEAMRSAGLDPELALRVPVHITLSALIQPKQAVSP